MNQTFKHLLSPKKIGSIEIPNRIVFNPHYTALENTDCTMQEQALRYYEERAKGGTGLLIVNSQAVTPYGKMSQKYIEAWDKKVLPGYLRVSDAIHRHGSKAFVQLSHAGHTTLLHPPQLLIAPSQMSEPCYHYNTKEMDKDDIRRVVEGFAIGASHVKQGGFDGVEVKGAAHDGLLRSFISPFFNRRTDEYGGTFENRMRFLLEVVHAIRESVGNDFPIGVRVCMKEYTRWGYDIEMGKRIVMALSRTGEVDYINTDAGGFSAFHMEVPPMEVYKGFSIEMAEAAKSVTHLPIVAFGRINAAMQAERILANGKADFVGMVRGLLCDPEFGNKVREGRPTDIRMCIACNDGCIYQVMQNEPIRCVHNPAGGREADFGTGTLHAAATKKKIAVIGGGPAGLKVAEIAARRGHTVTIYEKEKDLGGQLKIAARIPLRKEVLNVIRYLSGQVDKLGVEIRLNKEIDQDSVQKIQADVFIVATGSYPAPSTIPGSEQSNVTTVWNVLLERTQAGKRAVVYDITRRWPGLGTAEFLAEKGVKVYVITPAYVVGEQIPPGSVTMVFQSILKKGVEMIPMSEVTRVEGRNVTVYNLFSMREIILEDIDTVVLSVGNVSNRNLYDILKGEGKEVHAVGDAVAPRLIQQCILEAEVLARSL